MVGRVFIVAMVLCAGACVANSSGVGPTGGSSPSTETQTGEGPSSTDPGSGPTAGPDGGTATGSTAGSESGPADGTTMGSTGASTGSGTASSGSSTTAGEDAGVPEGEPYGPCGPGGTCMGADVVCYENGGLEMCLPPCDGTNPSCPDAPPDNEALVECVQVLGVHCMLNCAGGAACPAGTTCEEVFDGIFRCLWP